MWNPQALITTDFTSLTISATPMTLILLALLTAFEFRMIMTPPCLSLLSVAFIEEDLDMPVC